MPADCLICDTEMQSLKDMCRTDCNHTFCQSCICKKLSRVKNMCPACDSVVRVVTTQADGLNIQPTRVKFCNVIYILHVSIWFVEDPSSLLSKLFNLEQARVIHRGKILKKGDVWPGTTVQLFGSERKATSLGLCDWMATVRERVDFTRLFQILCLPFVLFYHFICSFFIHSKYQPVQQNRDDVPNSQLLISKPRSPSRSQFKEPGQVRIPPSGDTV